MNGLIVATFVTGEYVWK